MTKGNIELVYELYIKTTPKQLWQAITDPERTKRFFYGSAVESDWKVGSSVVHRDSDSGGAMLEGKVLVCDPPRKLVTTFSAAHDIRLRRDPPSKVTYQIEKRGEVCKLTVVHGGFKTKTGTYHSCKSGWNPVLSGLKTLLETGEALVIK